MRVCGIIFLVGIALAATAQHVGVLIIGRLLQGAGSAIGNTAIQLYSVEMAPAKMRGRLGYTFQVASVLSLGVSFPTIGSTGSMISAIRLCRITVWNCIQLSPISERRSCM